MRQSHAMNEISRRLLDVPASASQVSDSLAGIVAANPTRYGGLATLPMQDPPATTAELDCCATQLGFQGPGTARRRLDLHRRDRHARAAPDDQRSVRPLTPAHLLHTLRRRWPLDRTNQEVHRV
jgi:predicted TIM-barrel fold metal-dependent hydrolase